MKIREQFHGYLFCRLIYNRIKIPLLMSMFFILPTNSYAGSVKVYWTDLLNDKIERSNLDGSERETVLSNLEHPHGIAIDPIENKVYWSEAGSDALPDDTINRANLNGSDAEIILSGLDEPWDLAIDSCSRKLYWVRNKFDGKVYRCNLDGTEAEVAISLEPVEPINGICLDLTNGKIYWSNFSNDLIRRANLDGTGIETFATNVENAMGIALDIKNEKVYWMENHWEHATSLERQNFDGSSREVLIETISGYGLAIDTAEGKLYWTDIENDNIVRSNLDGSNVEVLVSSGLRVPQGIALGSDRESRTSPKVVTYQVQASLDDGYASDVVTQDLIDSVVYLGTKANRYHMPFPTSAMRFADVQIPPAIEISEAYLNICSADSTIIGQVYGTIQAEASDNPVNFAGRDIGSLTKTVAAVDWDHLTDWQATTWYSSGDISFVVQEIVDRPGWVKGNALALIYSTREKTPHTRAFSTWDRSAALAPVLEVRYGGYKITGYVTDLAGVGIENVEISGTGIAQPAYTNYYGYYELYVPRSWSGMVTNNTGWHLTPESREYTAIQEDLSGQDYNGYKPLISGYVKTEQGAGVEGVAVSADNGGGSDTTDAAGYYEIIVPYDWSGTVTSDGLGWEISPASRNYSNVTSDQVSQDFSAVYVGVTVKKDGTGDFTTIQAAIDAAPAGNTIVVYPDTYYENIHFKGKDIVLTSTEPNNPVVVDGTIIDGGGLASVVTFDGTETGDCELAGFTITGGNADYGGGLWGQGAGATITKCIISGNNTGWYGGGLYQCHGTISDCTISSNSARGHGGGLYKCHGTIINCTISNNSVTDTHGSGGGLDHCDGDIIDCTVSGNTALQYNAIGGGIAYSNGTITGCTISNNSAQVAGGMYDCDGAITGCTISDNSAANGIGGGVCRSGGTITNCEITGNSAFHGGGGLAYYDGMVKNCTISGNSVTAGRGGGLYQCNATIQSCLILDNWADEYGGGLIYCDGTIMNCTISGNSAAWSGGGLSWCDGTIMNCTIVGNSADSSWGALYNCTAQITNCIIWGNSLNQISNSFSLSPKYSCIQNWSLGGEGNINTDPVFLADGYHLSGYSPCIDAGDPNYVGDPNDTDIDGDPRVVGRIDIGADELFGSGAALISLSPVEFQFTALEDRPNPPPAGLLIRNHGQVALNWSIYELVSKRQYILVQSVWYGHIYS